MATITTDKTNEAEVRTRIVFPSGEGYIIDLPEKKKIAKNFCVWEVANRKAKEDIKLVITWDMMRFVTRMQMLRDKMGVMNLTSLYRTKTYNLSCGGSHNSLHLKGRACDMTKEYHKQPEWIDEWYEISKREGFIGGVNRYPDRMHIDDNEDYYGYKDFVIRDYTRMVGNKPTVTYRKY